MILKHAAQTILVGERFQRRWTRAGLPQGLFHNLVLTHDQTARILVAGLVDHCNFTGSVAGGRAIERAAAGTFTSLGLELGGKDPAYVRADANFAHAVENLVDGAFFNSGQCCCGIERIYVHESLYDRFVEGSVDLTKAMCSAIRSMRRRRSVRWRTCASPTSCASRPPKRWPRAPRRISTPQPFRPTRATTAYLAPQVLTDVDHSMAVMRRRASAPWSAS